MDSCAATAAIQYPPHQHTLAAAHAHRGRVTVDSVWRRGAAPRQLDGRTNPDPSPSRLPRRPRTVQQRRHALSDRRPPPALGAGPDTRAAAPFTMRRRV